MFITANPNNCERVNYMIGLTMLNKTVYPKKTKKNKNTPKNTRENKFTAPLQINNSTVIQ